MENTCEVSPKPKNFKEFVQSKKFVKTAIGVALGCMAGFALYYFYGCTSGNCGITSNPYSSVVWGGLFGLFVTNRPCGC